jgi:acetyl esterase
MASYSPSIFAEQIARSIPLLILVFVFPMAAFPQVLSKSFSGDSASQPSQTSSKDSDSKGPADAQLKKIIDQMVAAGIVHPTTLGQAEKAYLFYTRFSGSPENVLRVDNRNISTPIGSIPVRLYYPRDERNLPVWVFFHGGGFVAGNLETHDVTLRAVTNRCNCIVVSVAYRLAPNHPFPAAPNDCYAATAWVKDNAAEIGGDPNRIAVGGDGAGGNLAAVVALMARDRGGPHLSYQILIYPILDAAMSTKSWIESADPLLTNDAMLAKLGAYVPLSPEFANPLANPYISPANAPSLKGLPSAFIITDENDPLRDEDKHYADDLKYAGISVELSNYPNVIHGFFLMSGELDAGKRSIDQVSAALRKAFTKN